MENIEKDNQKKEIAVRIREIRSNGNLTQEQFAELLDLSLSAYKKLESGVNQISIETLRKMKQQLKVSSDYILFGESKDSDEAWELFLNCSEYEKLLLFFRLMKYYTRMGKREYPTKEEQAIYDKKLREVLKEIDVE